jgi:hypothetical protein
MTLSEALYIDLLSNELNVVYQFPLLFAVKEEWDYSSRSPQKESEL